MYHNQNFGMMDEGYFVPKSQILNWLNSLLQLNLTKIQQLGAGSVYCQVLDVIHPGTVGMGKVNWKAKNDYEFIANLKILQNGFAKAGIKKHLEVQKLAKAKYQDNLQLIQWFKRYFDKNCGDRASNYNPQERRGNVVIDFSFADKNVVPKTYNSSGVVISNKNPIVTEKPKKQVPKDESNQIHSPRPVKNPQPKHQVKSNVRIPSSNVGKRPTPQKVENTKNQGSKNQSQKVKDLEMKIFMIMEVLRSQDDYNLKVGLIEQILDFKKQENHISNSPSQNQGYQNKSPQQQQHQQEEKVQYTEQNEHEDII